MENNYLITMETVRQDEGGREERASFTTEGSLSQKNGHFFLILANSGVEGFQQARTTLKITENSVTLTRYEPMSTQMFFEAGKLYTCIYHTPFGSMNVGLRTRVLSVEMDDDGGRVYLDYALELGDMPTIRNRMTVTVCRKPAD